MVLKIFILQSPCINKVNKFTTYNLNKYYFIFKSKNCISIIHYNLSSISLYYFISSNIKYYYVNTFRNLIYKNTLSVFPTVYFYNNSIKILYKTHISFLRPVILF